MVQKLAQFAISHTFKSGQHASSNFQPQNRFLISAGMSYSMSILVEVNHNLVVEQARTIWKGGIGVLYVGPVSYLDE